ncbi:class D sortase [Halobacillus yeomjeoni]|uniref:class D sortase n=1 Tax=Halobacillus yeomjeoni TaxID=311194 RepID=UPI001CD293FF|nr:class D sortase [Halobacillus yeomjeoni]MCA0984068.1 class D sortase [Halobacillus yeomjeoni]
MKKFGFILLMIGAAVIIWGGHSWWSQVNAITHDPVKIQEEHQGWKKTEAQKTVKTLERVKKDHNFETGEKVGSLAIPRIGNQYDVFWGTGEDTLKKGVGLHESKWTTTPDQQGHVVLSGHRETVFRNLDKVKKGDHLYVDFEGVTYDYQVRKIWITHEDDRSVIVKKDKPTLTLTTCYPFDYVGSAPKRYIIQAELVSKESQNE